MDYQAMTRDELIAELAERDERDAEAHMERYLVGDARPGDTGMTKDDYAEIYARNPDLMD